MKINLRSRGWGLPILLVVAPLLIGIVYYLFLAVDRYESVSHVVVRQAGADGGGASGGLAMLITGGANPASREETLYLNDFIHSFSMMKSLDENLGWSKHFSNQKTDPLYYLSSDASDEDKLKFYRRVVDLYFNTNTGLLQIRIQALDPEFAKQVVEYILKRSEDLVNELSHRMGRDQVRFAQSELALAKSNYEARQTALLEFQAKNRVIDAEANAAARAQIIGGLETQLAESRSELSALEVSLGRDAPQIRQKRIRIGALQEQITKERDRLVSASEGAQLSLAASEYRNLILDAGISEEIYKTAVNAVEGARIEASKKIRSLMIIVDPNLADEPVYPKRLYNLATMLFFLCLIYGIVRFVVATIEDHRD